MVNNTRRRQGWFLENLSLRKAMNMASAAWQFAAKSERVTAWPPAVKIDISPLCNLSCTVCVHADPHDNPNLEKQDFRSNQKMTVAQYRRIIDEIKGKSTAVSLYYLGDPLVHPDLDEMSRIARDAGLNVHISTNFSFRLTDERIRRIVQSGLTHMTVCVDGLSQEKYELTRVGGRIDWVLNNLQRLIQYRRECGGEYPKVEVQYIKFAHNVDELEPARRMFDSLGIDQVTDFWGNLHNYTDFDPGLLAVGAPKKKERVPQCFWPHLSMVIKYNGDVIPCCSYRLGHQYTAVDDPHIFGNVFETSVWEVWNSPKYRKARRMVSDPESVLQDPSLKDEFCYGCGVIFEGEADMRRLEGPEVKWDDHYTHDERGRPRRRATVSAIGLPDGTVVAVG